MATSVQPALSDQEMLSQTETEDTDSGEIVTGSSESNTGSSTLDTSLDSTGTGDSTQTLSSEEQEKPACVSVDLTEVTELDENSSVVDEFSEYATRDDKKIRRDASKTQAGFPDWSSSDWYKHSCFKPYWEHYNQVMSWCRKHHQVYNKLTKKHAKDNGKTREKFHPYNVQYTQQWYHPFINTAGYPYAANLDTLNYRSDLDRKASHRKKKKQKQRRPKSECELTCSETQTDNSEEFQMEVTPEMIEFFSKTQEHRRQREEAKKSQKGEEDEPEHINVEDLKVTATKAPTVEAPKERPGARRTAEMKLLYGKGAAMIHGMETALQMTFDRNTDLKQPKIWPNMPLKVVFK